MHFIIVNLLCLLMLKIEKARPAWIEAISGNQNTITKLRIVTGY